LKKNEGSNLDFKTIAEMAHLNHYMSLNFEENNLEDYYRDAGNVFGRKQENKNQEKVDEMQA
jgi:hypothetical protein